MSKFSIYKSIHINMWVMMFFMVTILGVQFYTHSNDKAEYQLQLRITEFTNTSISMRKLADDLSYMARMYVLTENNQYKNIYFKILNLRDGDKPVPKNYYNYLSSLESNINYDIETGTTIELSNYLSDYLSGQEKTKNNLLNSILIRSKNLSLYEMEAFKLCEQGQCQQAIKMLTSDDYLIKKNEISERTNQAISIIKNKINTEIEQAQNRKNISTIVTYSILIITILFILLFNHKIKFIITEPIEGLTKWGYKVSKGEYNLKLTTEVPIELKELKGTMSTMASNTHILIEKLNNAAYHDELTGLPNRHSVNQIISKLQQEDASYSLILLDVDNFKKVNDTYGHQVGDDVLINISNVISKHLRETDFFARLGGEEFLIIAPNKGDNSGYHKSDNSGFLLADKVRQRVAEFNHQSSNGEFQVTITCGVTILNNKNQYDKAYKQADDALYQGKENGRNTVRQWKRS